MKNYRIVNEWAKKNIKNNINKIKKKLANIILSNALYFESFWDKNYLPKMTQNIDILIYNDES